MYIIFTNYSTIYDINLLYIYILYIYIYIDCIKYIDIIIIYQLSILSSLVPANSSMAFFNRSNGPSDFSFASLNCPNKES